MTSPMQISYDTPFSLTGANGDTITFNGIDGFAVASLNGSTSVTGLHAPPVTIQSTDGALDGSRYQRTRHNARTVDLSVLVFGANSNEFRYRLRRLHNLLAGKIILQFANEIGEVVQSTVYYSGGAEGERKIGTGSITYQSYVVTLWSGDPYWTSATAVSQKFSVAGATRGLLPRLVNLRLSSSQIIGTNIQVTNLGDVASFPAWTVNGPFTSFTISSDSLGKGFTYTGSMIAGQSVTVDTDSKTVVDQNGANQWANMGSAPALFALPPGTTSMTISVIGATTTSQVQMIFYPRYQIAV